MKNQGEIPRGKVCSMPRSLANPTYGHQLADAVSELIKELHATGRELPFYIALIHERLYASYAEYVCFADVNSCPPRRPEDTGRIFDIPTELLERGIKYAKQATQGLRESIDYLVSSGLTEDQVIELASSVRESDIDKVNRLIPIFNLLETGYILKQIGTYLIQLKGRRKRHFL